MQNTSPEIDKLIGALSKAQGEMSGASKDCDNPFFKSKYADLSSVWTACREALSKHELAVVQTMIKQDGELCLCTTLGHASGQWISSMLPIKPPVAKEGRVNEMQLLGSAITYLRRYALASIVGVAPDEDDDANSLTQQAPARTSQVQESRTTQTMQKISDKQYQMIKDAIGTDTKFEKRLNDYLKSIQISDLKNLPVEYFDRYMNWALQNKEQNLQEAQNAVA